MNVTPVFRNLSETSSNVAWFYVPDSPEGLDWIQPGWYAHGTNGKGLQNVKVTDVSDSVDSAWKYVTIEEPNVFQNGGSNYVFTSYENILSENSFTITATYGNVAAESTNTAWFFVGDNPQFLKLVQPGWFAQGSGFEDVPVTNVSFSVDDTLCFITVAEPNLFENNGSGFRFTSRALTPVSVVEPAASEPAASEPAASEPAASEPAASEPASSEPAASEPAASEPAASEPAASEPAASEPAASEPAASEPAASEPAASEPAASEPAASEPAN